MGPRDHRTAPLAPRRPATRVCECRYARSRNLQYDLAISDLKGLDPFSATLLPALSARSANYDTRTIERAVLDLPHPLP